MDRAQVLFHLKALIQIEKQRATLARPYLDRANQRRAEQAHWDNVQALRQAVDELEGLSIGKGETPSRDCPEPARELDEYVCVRCRMRWDVKEDKPPCQN